MKNRILFSLFAALLVTGCGYTPEEANSLTQASFAYPELVGTIQGKSVYCAKVVRPGGYHDHYVYFCEDTVSVNRTVPNGKSTRNMVVVIINGRSYTNVLEDVEVR